MRLSFIKIFVFCLVLVGGVFMFERGKAFALDVPGVHKTDSYCCVYYDGEQKDEMCVARNVQVLPQAGNSLEIIPGLEEEFPCGQYDSAAHAVNLSSGQVKLEKFEWLGDDNLGATGGVVFPTNLISAIKLRGTKESRVGWDSYKISPYKKSGKMCFFPKDIDHGAQYNSSYYLDTGSIGGAWDQANKGGACAAGIALEDQSFFQEWHDTYMHLVRTIVKQGVAQPACCIPKKKEDNLSCHPPGINETLFKDFSVANVLVEAQDLVTCDPDFMEGAISATQKDEYFLFSTACDDVTEMQTPPSIDPNHWKQYLDANKEVSQNLKFTTNYWCSVQDPNYVRWCACKSDFSVCNQHTEESACRDEIKKNGGGECKKLSNLSGNKDGSCADFVVNPGETGDGKGVVGQPWKLPDTGVLNQLGGTTIQQLIGRMISMVLGIIGTIALIMVIFAGFLFMTAAGSPEKQKKATSILTWSALSILAIFLSYAAVSFIFDAFVKV